MASTVVTCKVVASTRTWASRPSSSLSASAQSQLATRPNAAFTYIQFGLPRDLPGSTVTSARLQIRATGNWGGTRTLTAQRIAGPVSYAAMTWNNAPGVLSGSVARTGGPTGVYWHEIDVTADFQAIAAGGAYYGHRIQNSETTLTRTWVGRTDPTSYPRLVLTYATDTPRPSGVTPNGTVGVSKPVFTWAAPSDITKIQAQADVAGGSFASPTWSSGDIVTNIGHVDTNALGWAGLANGGSADFRFRQFGALGWSAWSSTVSVTRQDFAALTTQLPVSGGTSNDPTPPHAWTFSGQSRFRLWITDADRKTLYDSHVIAGSDQSWTPVLPSMSIPDTATLTSNLEVWDTRTDRVASPGDPGYVRTSWSWTIAPDAATTGVTNFNAVLQANRPAPLLTWTRASGAPDEWIVKRNGRLVARFDGDTGQQTTTTWAYEDWACPPNQQVTYSVIAVVANKMSPASPTKTLTNTLSGVLIYEPTTGAYVNVADEAAGDDLEMGESSVMYQGPYAQGPVKRILALGGISGSVKGFLSDINDRSIAAQLADTALIRSYPTRTCRLIWGYVNVPVVVSNISTGLASSAVPRHMLHRISFTVDQVDEFTTGPAGTPV